MVHPIAWFAFGLALGAVRSQDNVTEDQPEARTVIIEANNAFSVDLYETIRSRSGNLIVSPLSADAVLALVLLGAGGRTAQQLAQALRLPSDQNTVQQGYKSLLESLQESDKVIVQIANKIYAAEGSDIKQPFQSVAEESFDAETQELDFANDNEGSARVINQWVEERTGGMIKDLIGELDPSTLIVLVNALYFNGSWEKPFKERETSNTSFHTSPTSQVEVAMMHQNANFAHGYIGELNARAIELPYVGETMKMLIVLPNEIDGLQNVEESLKNVDFTEISNRLTKEYVSLSLPKFTIDSTFQLEQNLRQLGVQDLFDSNANLTGITDKSVSVSSVVQKAFVEVDEAGTVAAAATAVIMTLTAVIQPPATIFRVDHPFLFFIMNSNNTILFMGRVMQP